MTCWTRRLRCLESGSTGRTCAADRRGTKPSSLHSVERAALLAIGDAGGVEGAADHLVSDSRQVLDPAAAHEHDGMLLKVVALAGDVGGDLHPVGEPHAGDLAQGRVRLLRRHGRDTGADAPPLRCGHALLAPLAGLEPRRRDLLLRALAALPDELIRVRHGGEWYRYAAH